MAKQNRTEFIRVEKNRDYTMIHNQFLKRNDISWKAKGILAYILSLPDDWNINLNEVMTHATEGERAFRSGWKELKDAGYVEREPVRDGNRINYWETIVRESVDVKASSELCCFEDVQNEDVHNEDVQNDKLPITNNTNNLNKPITKDNNSPAKAERIPYKKIIDYLNQEADRQFSYVADSNRKLIKARWNELKKTHKGITEDELLNSFKTVIDNKVADAKDPKHFFDEQYLRPSTLFRGSNFDDYLNQPPRRSEKEVNNIGHPEF